MVTLSLPVGNELPTYATLRQHLYQQRQAIRDVEAMHSGSLRIIITEYFFRKLSVTPFETVNERYRQTVNYLIRHGCGLCGLSVHMLDKWYRIASQRLNSFALTAQRQREWNALQRSQQFIVTAVAKHLYYCCCHKWRVFLECCALGVPIRGLLHDISKFSWSEFWDYALFHAAPNEYKEYAYRNYARARQHHLRHNPHHLAYWIVRGTMPVPMPGAYVKEMVADWKVGKPKGNMSALDWYHKTYSQDCLHPQTQADIEALLRPSPDKPLNLGWMQRMIRHMQSVTGEKLTKELPCVN